MNQGRGREQGGEVLHLCCWSNIIGLWKSEDDKGRSEGGIDIYRWSANGESEREMWGGCHCSVLSDKWVFTCLQPPPRCNKSWHLFVTYDCISDCLGHDSIPTPRSASDGRIAGLEWWRNRGVCGSKGSTNATPYLGEGYRRCRGVCVCARVCSE